MLSLFNTGYGLQDQLDGVKNGIAIVATNNTHIAITSGQYVYIQDHGTLAEGLYRATANIAANGTLSGSNVTAVSGGGLNALNSNLNTIIIQNDIGTFSTTAQLTGYIDTVISGMTTYTIYSFKATASATVDLFVNGHIYSGSIFKYGSNNYAHVIAYDNGGNEPITMMKNGGTWTVDKLALNSNLNSLTSISDVKSQLTPATGITINSMIKQEIGRLVIAYMMITTSSAISANTEIVSGMPTPYGTQNYVTTFLAHTALTTELDTYRFSLLDGGKIINLDALPDGKIIRATFTYFKNS